MSEFERVHASDIALAAAYQRRGRADASIREYCADKIDEIYSRLESLLPKEGTDGTEG